MLAGFLFEPRRKVATGVPSACVLRRVPPVARTRSKGIAPSRSVHGPHGPRLRWPAVGRPRCVWSGLTQPPQPCPPFPPRGESEPTPLEPPHFEPHTLDRPSRGLPLSQTVNPISAPRFCRSQKQKKGLGRLSESPTSNPCTDFVRTRLRPAPHMPSPHADRQTRSGALASCPAAGHPAPSGPRAGVIA